MNSNYSALDLTGSLSDPQIKLGKALFDRNIQEFRNALDIGAKPLAIDDQHLSVFEKALQMPGCAEFVDECLRRQCDPNYVNDYYGKAAINYATDSRDPKILKVFLKKTDIKIDHVYSGLTPLNSLAKNINNENFNEVFECMELLLQYGASPNIPDQREMTPLHSIVQNTKISATQKSLLVKRLLSITDIDIDTFRKGELRSVLEDKYPLMELPGKGVNRSNTFQTLRTYIRNGEMDLFQQQYSNVSRDITEDENVQLLIDSIESGANKAFDVLLQSGVDYNKTLRKNNSPIEIALIYGNWCGLETLLQQPDIKISNNNQPLCCIVRKLNEESHLEYCNYWKCFYVLLKSDKIDVNARDFSKSTALHYAVKYRNDEAVKELLKKGACIYLKNAFNEIPLSGMSPAVLEEHLNYCVSSNNEKWGDKSYEIIINFMNFKPAKKKNSEQLRQVLTPIAFMAKSKEYRYLLQHPVITTILHLKWQKLSLIFYVNFLCYLFFTLSIVTHAVLKFRETDYELITTISAYCSLLGICYLIGREFVQLLVAPLNYVLSPTNYLEILLIVLSILSCGGEFIQLNMKEESQRNLTVVCILLTSYSLCLLVGSIPVASISTYMLMLKAVCKSFLKGFLLYSIFIVTFGLCFYIMNDTPANNESETNNEDAFHKFPNPLVAFVKTVVMFTGELEAGSLKLDSNYSYLLFLLFVFFMTIILFNLLNGLAVSDTQTIKDQAELNDIICRTQLLSRYESVVFKQKVIPSNILKTDIFRYILRFLNKLMPSYTTEILISILPNDNNKIIKTTTLNKGNNDRDFFQILSEEQSAQKRTILHCFFSFITDKCSRIDKRTVTQALIILENKTVQTVENRLATIEQLLHKIAKRLEVQENGNECD